MGVAPALGSRLWAPGFLAPPRICEPQESRKTHSPKPQASSLDSKALSRKPPPNRCNIVTRGFCALNHNLVQQGGVSRMNPTTSNC
jgi:hypothetical protein